MWFNEEKEMHMVKSITRKELSTLTQQYHSALEKKQGWIIQAMEMVLDRIELGEVTIEGYTESYSKDSVQSYREWVKSKSGKIFIQEDNTRELF